MSRIKSAASAAIAAPKALSVGYWSGLKYPFKGMRFIYGQHPELAKIWIFPIIITLGFLILLFLGSNEFHAALTNMMWEEPTGDGFGASIGRFFHGFVEILVWLLMMVAGLLIVVVTSTVVAAPFNDALSEAVECIVTGTEPKPFSLGVVLRDTVRTVGLELLKLLLYALVMVPLFLASLVVPVVGQILYTVFGFFFTATYFAIDYVDWPASRQNRGIGYRLELIRQNFLPMLGFGSGVWLCLFIPLVNLLFMPAAVAGGTLLFLDLQLASRSQSSEPG